MNAPHDRAPPDTPASARRIGRFVLTGLLGRSERTMAWRVQDTQSGEPRVLVMPRQRLATADARQQWELTARRAARLRHPNLAPALEVASQGNWPYVAYDARGLTGLTAWLQGKPAAAREVASVVMQIGQALAYAHDSGAVHADLQPYLVLVNEIGSARLLGLEVDQAGIGWDGPAGEGQAAAALAQVDRLHAQRRAARHDVLALGLLLHLALSGQSPLDEPDFGRVIARMPPRGRDIVRVPWNTRRPIPEALRAIANRATDRQERQRYRSARTVVHALEGFLRADAEGGAGALALLVGRLDSVGVLPASPGSAERAARLAMMDKQRLNELAALILEDIALSFELLRVVNASVVRGVRVSRTGSVLTVRRAIAMLGLNGVRRAALALRRWPGPLDETGAHGLRVLMQRTRRAGRIAQALRPPEWDGEVVALVTMLQNLGSLVVQYHFPDDAAQIRRLTQPAPAAHPGAAEEPGMSEQAASCAVIGVDTDTVGTAVARHWGLGDAVAQLIRRLPPSANVHTPHTDEEFLRTLASCANEVTEALSRGSERSRAGVDRVARRYAHALKVTPSMLYEAAQASLAPPAPQNPGVRGVPQAFEPSTERVGDEP